MDRLDMGRAPLDELAEHCLAARDLIDTVGDAVMRAAIDLLLAEVGRALAEARPPERAADG